MDSDKFKISEQNMRGKGVSAQSNPMELPEAEAKAVFDQLVKEVVVPKFNEILDALEPIDLTSDEDKPISTATQAAIGLKVDKEKKTGSTTENKVLSDNNYSDSEKTKLSGIADHANNYVHPATHDASMITGLATLAHNVVDGNNTGAVRTVGAKSDYTMGQHAFAEGVNTVASGNYSHGEGYNTTASGAYSHVEGAGAIASASYAHSEGHNAVASGACSHSEGENTTASGIYSHAEGLSNTASGNNSHVEGQSAIASGFCVHAEGNSTTASGSNSHAEGCQTIANGNSSHAEGSSTIVSGNYGGHAEGNGSIAAADQSVFKILSKDVANNKIFVDTSYFSYGVTSFNRLAVNGQILVRNTVYTRSAPLVYTIASIDNVEYSITIGEIMPSSTFSPDFFVCFAAGDGSTYRAPHAEGRNVLACGASSHAEGDTTNALGVSSHAEGNYTVAKGDYSHAEGSLTNASGYTAHAEGNATVASGGYSHSEGYSNTASGNNSHAEGCQTIASGYTAHAEGQITIASGYTAHAEGFNTVANGERSHAEGDGTLVSGNYGGHAEGSGSIAVTNKCVFKIFSADKDAKKFVIDANYFPYGTTPFDNLSVGDEILVRNPLYTTASLLKYTIASIDNIEHSIIINEPITPSFFSPDFFVCFAVRDTSVYQSAHAEGRNVLASGYSSHAEGDRTVASGNSSHAEGDRTVASGNYSHAEGYYTTASVPYSHAEGANTTASGGYAHAEGYYSTASGSCSHAECANSTASGNYSHAEGYHVTASGSYSHAEGNNTIAGTYALHTQGQYNTVSSGSASVFSLTQNAFVIGNGTASDAKSNCFRIDFSGNVYGLSAFNSTGADYAEYFEWEDGNSDAEDRRGKFVTLNGDKIKIAQEGDFILGVVSSNPAIVGNHPSEVWKDMYLTDVWGDYIMEWRTIPAQTEMVTLYHDEVVSEEVVEINDDGEEQTTTEDKIVTKTEEVEQVIVDKHQEYLPVINPDYDPNQTYISRDKRKEWATIGMMGQLIVYTDGSCIVNGFCKCGNGGIATMATEGYRVLKVIDNDKVLILLK